VAVVDRMVEDRVIEACVLEAAEAAACYSRTVPGVDKATMLHNWLAADTRPGVEAVNLVAVARAARAVAVHKDLAPGQGTTTWWTEASVAGC